jgi:hypothetical protein
MIDLAFTLTIVAAVLLGYAVALEIIDCRKQHREARVRRAERELAAVRSRLEALALQHKAWLQGQAHEARKALIMESYRVSGKANGKTNNE